MSLRRLLLARRGLLLKLVLLLPLLLFFLLITTHKVPALGADGNGGHQNNNNNIPSNSKEKDKPHYEALVDVVESNNAIDNNVDNVPVLLPPGDNPGEMGKPYKPGNLTAAQKKLVSSGWKDNAFNQFVSDLISVKRSLPDPRDQWCKEQSYYSSSVSDLKPTSVIICFHNEAWSVLLRSVHSVLDRSPDELITEVILVDDFSDMDHLKKPLETYFKKYPKVKVVRATKREGLIRARLLGADAATGPILTFLDSHVEATTGWLEPLLSRITETPTTVVCPVIDVIDDDTLEYHFSDSKGTSVGGFDWNLQFTWHAIPENERKRRKNSAEPVYSPTMAGGLFSIDKAFFDKLGKYDDGFDIWGGENLEISFKTWMCGGTLEIIPCSHVGHIFRKRSPYKWRSGVNVLRRNSVRLAEVWMDDYKEYYYQRIGHDLGKFGDISARQELRRDLNCKSFKWYLASVYPELFIPGEAVAHGEIRNMGLGGSTCLDSPATKKQMNQPVGLYPCHGQGGNQYWSYSKTGEIRRDEMCVDFAGQDVMIYPCHGSLGNQQWIYEEDTRHVRHGPSRKCLAIKTKEKLVMESCDDEDDKQKWKFENYDKSKL